MAAFDLQGIQTALHELIVGRAQWAETLGIVSETIGARGAVLIGTDKPGLLASSAALAEVSDRYLAEGWQARDIRFRGLQKVLRTGIAVDHDYADENEIRNSPYYNDFLSPHGLLWSGIIGLPTSGGHCVISFQRLRSQGPFTEADQKALLAIRPLISNAVEVAQLLESARIGGLLDGLEMFRVGALALAGSGRVVHMNAQARTMMPGLFRIVGGKLELQDRKAAQLFNRRVAAQADGGDAGEMAPILARVAPASDTLPCLCYVVPVAEGRTHSPLAACRSLVLFLDPAKERAPAAEQLAGLFKLTTAQARIAAQLAKGASLEAVARSNGITKETVRNHLKAIFEKTGTSRQGELVAVLMRLLAPHLASSRE